VPPQADPSHPEHLSWLTDHLNGLLATGLLVITAGHVQKPGALVFDPEQGGFRKIP